ncbi:hypothetical protein DWB84_08755 [Saccharophagus sp. K07]|nr:hypothetical protein [Saccharophagus sp. K07]
MRAFIIAAPLMVERIPTNPAKFLSAESFIGIRALIGAEFSAVHIGLWICNGVCQRLDMVAGRKAAGREIRPAVAGLVY